MVIQIADELLIGISEKELMLEIAVLLFQREKLTLGQASAFAHLHQMQFQQELAKRKIPIHYDVSEFQKDLQTLERLKLSARTL